MQRTYIGDLGNHIEQEVKVQGWLQILRDQKKMQFLILRDRTGLVQVAHYRPANEELANKISTLSVESALTITGKVVKNDVVKLGGLEIQLESLTVENWRNLPCPMIHLMTRMYHRWIFAWIGATLICADRKTC
jgi:aspartyl-tRNA synthetase